MCRFSLPARLSDPEAEGFYAAMGATVERHVDVDGGPRLGVSWFDLRRRGRVTWAPIVDAVEGARDHDRDRMPDVGQHTGPTIDLSADSRRRTSSTSTRTVLG
ncbi:MAG: hypothetical protein WBL35_12270 [Ornithinibacter sp.]